MDRHACAGFSLVELLVVIAVLGILVSTAIANPVAMKQNLELETGLRRLRIGRERGRVAAERSQQPCALSLSLIGWDAPLAGELPVCRGGTL